MRKYFSLSSSNLKLWFWLILIVGLGLRLYYMIAPVTKLSADETVYGVQALNILHGERSVFYYNQNYTGTFSAFITAIFFALFGVTPLLVKLPIFLFAAGFLVAEYFLAKLVFNSKGLALLVLALTAVTAPFWINWTTRAGTGYPETMLLGNLIFILVIKNLFEKTATKFQSLSFLGIGFLAGLGYWIQPTIVYYLLPSVAVIFLWKPKIFLTRLFPLGILGFVVGSLPVIVFNLNHQNLNTQSLFHKPFGVKKAMVDFFTVGLPVIFGLRKPFFTTDFFTPLTIIVGGVYLMAFLFLLTKRVPDLVASFSFGLLSKDHKFKINSQLLKPIDLILLLLISTFIVFSLSSPFNQFVSEPRYISPIYTALPIVIVFLIKTLVEKSFWLAILIFLVILGSQAYGLWQLPPKSFQGQINLDQTLLKLNEKGINYVDTHAYLSYRLVLESKGAIIAATRDNPPIEARYPDYRKMVDGAPVEQKAWLLDHDQPLPPCESDLRQQLGPCQQERLDNGLYLYTWR